jgi:uncharacterized protein
MSSKHRPPHAQALLEIQLLDFLYGEWEDLNQLLQEKREAILELAAKHGACNVRVFGSVARHEANEQSDIDLLVDTTEHTSPWFPVGFIQDLEALLGRKVDVVTENGVYWLLRRRILKEARPL